MWAEHWYKMRLAAYVFAGVGLLKAGIFIVAGGGAGYAIGYRRGQNSGTE